MNIEQIELRDVTVLAPQEPHQTLLDRIGLSIPAGKVTLVAGCAGSGKTTLLQLLAGLKRPSSGEIAGGAVPRGRRVTDGVPFGYMHQYPEEQFFLPVVRAELLYSLRALRLGRQERETRVRQAAEHCGLTDIQLRQSPFSLSGGQRRRLALATVLVTEPAWLVLDEPSAGLDSSMSAWLAKQIGSWKQEREQKASGGIVIASHDLDLFLPVADQVVLLSGGRVTGKWNREDIIRQPQLLAAAGLDIPDCIKLAGAGGAADLDVSAVTEALAARCRGNSGIIKKVHDGEQGTCADSDNSPDSIPDAFLLRAHAPNRLAELDPRAKWFSYLLFSILVLAGPAWPVTAAGMLLAYGAAAAGSIPASRWLRPILPFGWFLLLAFGIAGIDLPAAGEGLSGLRFQWQQGLPTLERLSSLIPVMAGGIIFSRSTPPMSVQKGLAAVLNRIPGFTKGAEWLSLAVALMFRFIRWLPAELNRFALLASLRGGKRLRASGKLRIRELPGFFIPLLLAVLQHAEELSMALTAKGYGHSGPKRTDAVPLQWKRRDTAVCLAAGAAAILLGIIRWLSPG